MRGSGRPRGASEGLWGCVGGSGQTSEDRSRTAGAPVCLGTALCSSPQGSLGYSRLRRRLNLGADLGSGGPDIPPMGLCSRVSGPSRAVDVNTGHVSGGRAPQIKGPQREALRSHLRASGQ